MAINFEQTRPPGSFHGICNDNLVENLFRSATVSRTVFNPAGSPDKPVKTGHLSEGFGHFWNDCQKNIAQTNNSLADPNKHQFNGKQLCVYFSVPEVADKQTGELGLKLIPSDYFSQAIARRSAPTDVNNDISTVRAAYNCGAIILVMTNDDKVVFGHRNEKPMFPAGFILGEKTQQTDESIEAILDKIGKSTTFADLARGTALNERKEEVYDDNGEWETEIKTFGAIGEVLCWPSKKEKQNYRKPVFVIKSTVFIEPIPVSSDEMKALREDNAPKDGHELRPLHFLGKDDLKDESKGKQFIAEHAKCFEMLSPFFTEKVAGKSR